MRRLMRQPVIFDGRNVFDPARMAALGFTLPGNRAGSAAPGMSASPRRSTRASILVSTRLLPSFVRHFLDVPPERLAAVIGAWPEPALLESGPDFGDIGAIQYPHGFSAPGLASDRPAMVFAHGQRPVRARSGRRTFKVGGAPQAVRTGAAGRSIGRLATAVSRRHDRLLRLRPGTRARAAAATADPRDSRLPDIRLALYDTAVVIDARSRHDRALELGLDRRRTSGCAEALPNLAAIDRAIPVVAASGASPTVSIRSAGIELVRPRDLSRKGRVACSNTSRPATSSR